MSKRRDLSSKRRRKYSIYDIVIVDFDLGTWEIFLRVRERSGTLILKTTFLAVGC